MHGSFDELYGTFLTLTSALREEDRDLLFAGTAERVYRC
jgi:hypothetical protein